MSQESPGLPPPLPPPIPPASSAPKRSSFGRVLRAMLLGVVVVLVCLGGAFWAFINYYGTTNFAEHPPELKPVPPLEAVTRTSVVIAPVAVALPAMRDAMEANAPRNFSGTHDNPYSNMLGKSDVSWTAERGPIQIVSTQSGVDISTSIAGTAKLSGQRNNSNDNISSRLGGLLGGRLGRQAEDLANRTLQQTAALSATVTVTGRPVLLPDWHFDPNLSGRTSLGDVKFAGFQFNVSSQIKPQLDSAMNEQMTTLSNRLRNDPMLELAVKPEWSKMCRSISLGASAPNAPPLWLEVRPTQAIAAQPRFVSDWVIITVGLRAETRIVPNETKPDCPFPSQLQIVPPVDKGQISIAVPIDVPLSELNRVMEQQLKGKTFSDDKNSVGEVTVLSVKLAASGDRLLVSLRVKASETKSWFGFSTEATVHLLGKPTLDPNSQIMRLSDVSLDVDTDALIGAAVRAAMPFVQSAIEKNAVVDLKPFATNALASIETMLAEFKKPVDGVEIDAAITGLRMASIAFDSKTMRVIGEVQGNARALVRKLPMK